MAATYKMLGVVPDKAQWRDRIKGLRDTLRLTMPELAKVLEVNPQTLNGWFIGKFMPSLKYQRSLEHLEYLIDAGYRVRPDLSFYRRYSATPGIGDGTAPGEEWAEDPSWSSVG